MLHFRSSYAAIAGIAWLWASGAVAASERPSRYDRAAVEPREPAAASASTPPAPLGPASLDNGSFETGDFARWHVVDSGVGAWVVTDAEAGPSTGLPLAPAWDGSFQAVTDMTGSGAHILYRDVDVPLAWRVELTFVVWVENYAEDFVDAGTLDFSGTDNQHVRIDLLDPTAPIDDTGAGVLESLFVTRAGDPLSLSPEVHVADVTAYAGKTVRLRVAEVDNLFYLNVGVDAVDVVALPSPYDVVLDVGDGTGDAGAEVTVPVTVRRPFDHTDPRTLADLDLDLRWDPGVATLADVEAGAAAADWTLAFDPVPGAVSISMASAAGLDVDQAAVELLRLHFTLSESFGESPLAIEAAAARDADLQTLELELEPGILAAGCDKGDVVDDDVVNTADAIRTLRIVVELYQPDSSEQCAADLDGDGGVTSGDAIGILRNAVGLDKRQELEPSAPRVTLRPGASADTAILEATGMAGLDAELRFDPARASVASITVESTTAARIGGLWTGHEPTPGRLKLAVANTTFEDLRILVRFDAPTGSAGTVTLARAVAFDATGAPRPELVLERRRITLAAKEKTPAVAGASLSAAPNPFNPSTRIRFALARAGSARLRVADAAGRLVRTFRLGALPAGTHAVEWDGTDERGRTLASGVYFAWLETDAGREGIRLVLLK